MSAIHCPRCWSEVASSKSVCPVCGAALGGRGGTTAPAVRWSDSLTYDIHVDDLSDVADRRALLTYLVSSGRFANAQELAERLSTLPCRLLTELTLEDSTEVKSNLMRFGARVRATRSAAEVTGTAPPPGNAPARRIGRRPRRTSIQRLTTWTWTIAALFLVAVTIGIGRLLREFRARSETYQVKRDEVERAANEPLVVVARGSHDPKSGEADRQRALAELELGHQEFDAGRLRTAVDRYATAHQLDPQNGDARDALTGAWVALGKTALAEERIGDALDAFDAGLAVDPDSRSAIRGSGRAAMLAGDLEGARHAFDRLAPIEATDSEAHAWAGEVYHSLGDLNHAEAEYRMAAGPTPDALLAERLDLVARERSALVEPTQHLRTLWLGEVDRGIRHAIEDALERAFGEVTARLGAAPAAPPRVVLDPAQPFAARSALRCGWQLTSLQGPRIPVGGATPALDDAAWGPVLRHELGHAVLRSFTSRPLPAWFGEGIAERLTSLDSAPRPVATLAQAVELRSLRWPFCSLAPEHRDAAFAGADLAARWLFAKDGWPAVARAVATLARGGDLDAALQAGFQVDSKAVDNLKLE